MTGSTMRRVGGVAALVLVLAIEGCAARPRGAFNCVDRRWAGGTIGGAIAGTMIGAGVGTGIVATSGETERQAEDYATAAVIGAVAGGIIGSVFGHCAFDPFWDEEPPPPPPAPEPPPPPPVRQKIVLRGVNFDFDKSTIRSDAEVILEEAARILRDDRDLRVSVDGHTDAMGTDAYNDRLSDRRAQAVVDRLVRLGVERSRLEPQGYGESRPVATNETEEGRAQNRRVELNVIR